MDAILAMLEPGPKQDPNVRRLRLDGRRSITRQRSSYAVRLIPTPVEVPTPRGPTIVTRDLYVLEPPAGTTATATAPAGPTVGEQIQAYVADHPGCAQHEIFKALRRDRTKLHGDIKALVEEGAINEARTGKKLLYFPPDSGLLGLAPAPEAAT